MKYLKYFLILLAFVAVPAVYSQAQVSFGVQVGPAYAYGPPPVCDYGYYPYYPYACAPYGYWGPQWFVSGVFIGAGPWYHWYYTHPGFYRGYYQRGFRGDWNHDRGFRGSEHVYNRAPAFRGGNNFHGGQAFHGGGGGNFHGGGGFRAGNGGGPRGGGGGGFHGGGGHGGGRGGGSHGR